MEKKPSDLWKDYVHENKGIEKAAKASYDLYIKKYVKHNKDFPTHEKFEDKLLISGKMYSFLYLTHEKPDAKRPYIDRRPIFLSFGQVIRQNQVLEIGIDFITVPPKIRMIMLDRVYKYYSKKIQENINNLNEGKKGKKPLNLDYAVAHKIFDKLGWQMAFTAYDRQKMGKIAVIDYNDWVAMIPLDTRGMEGKQIKEIYSEYIEKMSNAPETNLDI